MESFHQRVDIQVFLIQRHGRILRRISERPFQPPSLPGNQYKSKTTLTPVPSVNDRHLSPYILFHWVNNRVAYLHCMLPPLHCRFGDEYFTYSLCSEDDGDSDSDRSASN